MPPVGQSRCKPLFIQTSVGARLHHQHSARLHKHKHLRTNNGLVSHKRRRGGNTTLSFAANVTQTTNQTATAHIHTRCVGDSWLHALARMHQGVLVLAV